MQRQWHCIKTKHDEDLDQDARIDATDVIDLTQHCSKLQLARARVLDAARGDVDPFFCVLTDFSVSWPEFFGFPTLCFDRFFYVLTEFFLKAYRLRYAYLFTFYSTLKNQ